MEIVHSVQSRCASEAWGSGSRPNVAHDGLVGFFPFEFQLCNFILFQLHSTSKPHNRTTSLRNRSAPYLHKDCKVGHTGNKALTVHRDDPCATSARKGPSGGESTAGYVVKATASHYPVGSSIGGRLQLSTSSVLHLRLTEERPERGWSTIEAR
jgi:hypothetical protein